MTMNDQGKKVMQERIAKLGNKSLGEGATWNSESKESTASGNQEASQEAKPHLY